MGIARIDSLNRETVYGSTNSNPVFNQIKDLLKKYLIIDRLEKRMVKLILELLNHLQLTRPYFIELMINILV